MVHPTARLSSNAKAPDRQTEGRSGTRASARATGPAQRTRRSEVRGPRRPEPYFFFFAGFLAGFAAGFFAGLAAGFFAGAAFFAGAHSLDGFGLVVLNDEIDELARV